MKKPYQIAIAEDHTILREGLRALISMDPDFEIVAEAGDGREAIRCVEKFRPDLLLLDLSMPRMDGMSAMIDIKKRYPTTKIVALTVHKTEEYVLAALEAGANGYVLKDATHNELVVAIKSVLANRSYLSPGVSKTIINGYLHGSKDQRPGTVFETLSQREREVLKLIAEGYKNREIAEYLCLSAKTVEKHRSNLMKKLNLRNAAELTAFAIEKGIVTR
jgi:DNA-binding NarL/FixJ family response regulator